MQNKATPDRKKIFLNFVLFLVLANVTLTFIHVQIFDKVFSIDVSASSLFLGSMIGWFIPGLISGDFPSKWFGYNVPDTTQEKRKLRFLASFLMFLGAGFLFLNFPEYKTCSGHIVDYKFVETNNSQLDPLIKFQCDNGDMLQRLAIPIPRKKKEDIEPLLISAIKNDQRAQMIYSQNLGASGLKINETIIKKDNTLSTNAFPVCVLQIAWLMLLFGVLNVKIPRYGLKYSFTKFLTEREKLGEEAN